MEGQMPKKKLKPTLPKEEKEILEKGFDGNITDSKKFVTDGHSMFLAAAVPKGIKFDKNEVFYGKPVTEASIQTVWDEAEKRERVPAEFIGCGKPDEDTVVAVLRDERNRITTCNPYILKFNLAFLKADALAFGPGPKFYQEMMVLLREGKIVGAVMPMRFFEQDMQAYDLTAPAVPWSEV